MEFLSCLFLLLVAPQNAMIVSANDSMDKNARDKSLQREKEIKGDQLSAQQFAPGRVPEMSEDLQSIVISKEAADTFHTSQKKKSRRRLVTYCNAGQSWEEGGWWEYDKCHDCTPGKYVPYNQHTSTSCFDCSVGTYNTQPADTGCDYCVYGKYQNAVGQTSCNDCPAGWYNTFIADTICDICVYGKYQNAVGQTSCNNCGSGQWSNFGFSACADCWPGMYQHENIAGGACHHCVPGKYNLEYGKKLQSDCKDCDIGTYQDQNGYASTAAAAEIRSPCKNCAAGSYQDQQGQTSPLCVSFFFIFHF